MLYVKIRCLFLVVIVVIGIYICLEISICSVNTYASVIIFEINSLFLVVICNAFNNLCGNI